MNISSPAFHPKIHPSNFPLRAAASVALKKVFSLS